MKRGTTKDTNHTKEENRMSLSLITHFDESHLRTRGAGYADFEAISCVSWLEQVPGRAGVAAPEPRE